MNRNWRHFLTVALALLVALSLGSTRLAAQTSTTGDIAGVVTDPSNAVVPDAKISLRDNSKGATQEAKTNRDGAYRFYLLAPGSYTITVTVAGFQSMVQQAHVIVGQIATADLHLTLGASNQTVVVTEVAPLIQTENGDTASALSQQQVSNVPNPGNDLSAIAQLAPGVVVNSQGGFGNVEAFGLPATSNLFTVNGMDDNDPFLNLNNSGASNLLLGSNEIQEADVTTNAFSGGFGTFSGVQVNFVTKSGGNAFHGNAVYFWNGRALNANDWFNNDRGGAAAGFPRAFDNANQWAASIGGPIKKDKLFFFMNTEGLRVLIPVPTTISIPSAAFEGSVVENLQALGLGASVPFYCQNIAVTALDGTKITCPAGVPGAGTGIFNIFNNAKNVANAANSFNGGGCDNVGLGVGAGATKTTSPIFGNFGAANPCTLSLRETPVNFAPEKQIAGRADWNVGPNDRAYVRMQYDQGVQPTYTDPINPVFNAHSDQPEYQGQLNEIHTFSPTLTNQFLLAATWYSAVFNSPNQAASLSTFPGVLTVNDGALPLVGGINFAFPQGRNVTQFQVGDDVSKSLGNHTLRFGAKLHKNYVSDRDNGTGTVPLVVPITLADFANGGSPTAPGTLASVIIQTFPLSTNLPIRLYEAAGYVQDDWKIKSNLTITPSLRVEHASNPVCVTDCFGQFAAPFSSIVADGQLATPTPYNQEIQTGRRNALLGYQTLQWEPRIGFAWQPFGSATGMLRSDFVVRGGIGIFYDIFPGQVSDPMTANPPLSNPFTVATAAFGGSCPGFLSPNQFPGTNQNLYDCATSANAAFNNTFFTGGNSTATPPGMTFTPAQNFAPQFQKWSLEIQKGFGPNDSIDIGYVGNHGIHEPILNNTVNAFGIVSQLPAKAPTSQYGLIQEVLSAGVSNYNGIVASYKHRMSGSFGSGVLQLNYTYGHALDEISNGGFDPFTDNAAGVGAATSISHPQIPNNLRNSYGNADYDVRNSLNGNYVWELPFRKALGGRGWAPLVDGWQVSGAAFYRTGFPFSVVDPSLQGANNYGVSGGFGPYILPNPTAPIASSTCNSEQHFGLQGLNANPCAFAGGFPTVTCKNCGGSEGTFGANGLRNAFRGPSYFDTDFSFMKKTKIPGWERGQLQVGLQFFNVLNHPNFNLPSNSVTSPFFGTVQSTVNPPTSILGSFLGGDASPRLIQIKAQLVF